MIVGALVAVSFFFFKVPASYAGRERSRPRGGHGGGVVIGHHWEEAAVA